MKTTEDRLGGGGGGGQKTCIRPSIIQSQNNRPDLRSISSPDLSYFCHLGLYMQCCWVGIREWSSITGRGAEGGGGGGGK